MTPAGVSGNYETILIEMPIPTLSLDDLNLIYVSLGSVMELLTDEASLARAIRVQNLIGALIADLELERDARSRGILR